MDSTPSTSVFFPHPPSSPRPVPSNPHGFRSHPSASAFAIKMKINLSTFSSGLKNLSIPIRPSRWELLASHEPSNGPPKKHKRYPKPYPALTRSSIIGDAGPALGDPSIGRARPGGPRATSRTGFSSHRWIEGKRVFTHLSARDEGVVVARRLGVDDDRFDRRDARDRDDARARGRSRGGARRRGDAAVGDRRG